MLIYKLTFESGKSYVGQTRKTVEQRFRTHAKDAKHGSPLPVHCAWRKHGAPSVEVLSTCSTIEELNEAEIEAIAGYDCRVPNGYNLSGGGDNAIVHPSTCAKLANRVVGSEWRASMSAAAKSRVRLPRSNATRAKISTSTKAKWVSLGEEGAAKRVDAIAKAVQAHYDAMTPEDRVRFSEVRKRAWETRRARKAQGVN